MTRRIHQLTTHLLSSVLTLASATVARAEVSHQLIGWAALPSTARTPGPTSGNFAPTANGVVPPFTDGQVIPGWSGLLSNAAGSFTALPDNGFGSKGNSADYVLGVYDVAIDFKTSGDGTSAPGTISNQAFIAFNDSLGLLSNGARIDLVITADLPTYRNGNGFGLDSGISVDPTIRSGRLLTGYDFDVESIARDADGTYWVGEEFGPYVLHFDSDGTLLDEPVPHPFLKSPSNALVLNQPGTQTMTSSRGFESLSLDPSSGLIYVVAEAAPVLDELRAVPGDERVVDFFEFDPAPRAYTGRTFEYQKEGTAAANSILISDVANVGPGKFVVLERDGASGAAAQVKRLYLVDLATVDSKGILIKTLLVDLLRIEDPLGIGGPEAPAGVTPEPGRFSFALGGIEALARVDDHTLAVGLDTNYPSDALRAPGVPDNTEVILIEFADPLSSL
jgi:hypothetical protein